MAKTRLLPKVITTGDREIEGPPPRDLVEDLPPEVEISPKMKKLLEQEEPED